MSRERNAADFWMRLQNLKGKQAVSNDFVAFVQS
jgi:hypothetical protein